MKYCTKCGAVVSENAKFCENCGAKIEKAEFVDEQKFTDEENLSKITNVTTIHKKKINGKTVFQVSMFVLIISAIMGANGILDELTGITAVLSILMIPISIVWSIVDWFKDYKLRKMIGISNAKGNGKNLLIIIPVVLFVCLVGVLMASIDTTDDADDTARNSETEYYMTESTIGTTQNTQTEETKAREENVVEYSFNADEWYKQHISGKSNKKYINNKVKVSGTVLYISDYSDMKGYYLVGGAGNGLVCWVDSNKLDAQCGQYIEYEGTVTAEDPSVIEIANGKILSAKYPEKKLKSPVTISDWSTSRDYVGGVEWNFKFTNNSDKTIKYIYLEWDCYNAVGDPVYDEITGKNSHGVKHTGPLESGKSTNLLRTTNLFYSFSLTSVKFTRLEVEYMDGTKVSINDKAYYDIMPGK